MRHTGVVPSMAAACRAMRLKYGLSAEEVGRQEGVVWCRVTWCGAVLNGVVPCQMVWCRAVL